MESEVAEQPEPDSLIGQTLADRYLIEVRLGEGAMEIGRASCRERV